MEITADTFNIKSGQLQVADFDVLDSSVFVIDNIKGLYSYNVEDKSVNHFDLQSQYEIRNYFALAASYENGYYRFDIANETYLMSFISPNATGPL